MACFEHCTIIILFSIYGAGGSNLRFPVNSWTISIPEALYPPVPLQSQNAVGGTPPIRYELSATNTSDLQYFNIDTKGALSIALALDRENRSMFVFDKVAIDSRSARAILHVIVKVTDVNDHPPKCPISRVIFSVREVAPVGEVVGRVDCRDPDVGENAESVYTLESLINRFDTDDSAIPFTVTEHGNIIVSTPLAYRGSISDMYILSVRVRNKLDVITTTSAGQQRSADAAANVTVNITVEKDDCSGNWTYTANRNKLLSVPGIGNVTSATEDECMRACSAMRATPCNSFVFDLAFLRCILYNETEFTRPANVMDVDGFWLYRKQCHAEPLPSVQLRDIEKAIGNGSLDVAEALAYLVALHEFLINAKDGVYTDYWFSTHLLYVIINKTVPSDRSRDHHIQELADISNQVISRLLDDDVREVWQTCRKNGHDPSMVLDTFELLSEAILLKTNSEINVTSNLTAITAIDVRYGVISSGVNVGAGDGNDSGVILPDNVTMSIPNLRVVVGVLRNAAEILYTVSQNVFQDPESQVHLVGHVVSVVVSPYSDTMFTTPVRLDISTGQDMGEIQSRKCVFLQRGEDREKSWQTDGCRLVGSNQTHTRCECTHLTNFAVLMQVRSYKLNAGEETSLEVITIMGCSLSIAALASTIVILLWLRLYSERFVLLMNLSLAIIMAHTVFLTGINAIQSSTICRLVAILLHYLYLCVFTLMLAEGMQLYNKLHRALKREPNFNMYLVLGWGVPFAIVAISLATDVAGYGTRQHCWLSTERGTIWAFVGPALTIISINLVVLVMVIRTFLGVKINARKNDTEKFKSSVKAAVVLLPLLGLTWMFGVVAINANTVVFQYVFSVLNSLQGMFIFVFHVLLNEEVRKACGGRPRWSNVTGISDTDTNPAPTPGATPSTLGRDTIGLRKKQYMTSFQI